MLPFIQFTDFPPPPLFPPPPPRPPPLQTYIYNILYLHSVCQYELHEYSVHDYYHKNMFTYVSICVV
jgi:hypothetical protein